MNGADDAGDTVDISGSHRFGESSGKSDLLTGLHTPIDGSGGDDDDINFITRLQERYEDTRDALMESEPFAQVFESTSKLVKAGTAVWTFSKKAAWIVGTSGLILVVPLLYEMDKEMNAVAVGDPSLAVEPTSGKTTSDMA